MAESNPLSAYLHIPFCERKCIYCDFYSIENLSLRADFVALLEKEIELKLARYPALEGRTLETIFFGGGTPSLLTPDELRRIVAILRRHFLISHSVEFTLECNPGTIDQAKLAAYREIGANRLSFGVQSFHADELAFLGRIHDADQARAAIKFAREAGFDNVSLDLIHSLPNQTEEKLRYSLDEAIALDTNHISAYNLIVEPGTPLFRLVQLRKVIELNQDLAADLYELTQAKLAEAGFHQYEISNYAKTTETRAKHNLVYWDANKDYVSFGPSAHEFIAGERAWNVSSLEQYRVLIQQNVLPRINSEHPSLNERRTETLYLQLRSTGLRLTDFATHFHEDLLTNPEVQNFLMDGHLYLHLGHLSLTPSGYRFCDAIVRALIKAKESFLLA